MKTYRCLGLMSGSSLDGLDIVYCQFDFDDTTQEKKLIGWKLIQSGTYPFPLSWKTRLINIPKGSGLELVHAHADFGHFIGRGVNDFLKQNGISKEDIHFIASHGHTLFHEPGLGFTTQIGDGAAIAGETGITTICDFRSSDVALGGQGAPLAPLADRVLFPGYDFYLNIGGISNVTAAMPGKYIAFDVSGANQILNALAALEGLDFDKDGELAKSGKLIPELFDDLNDSDFFDQPYPKSLSNQWVQQNPVASCLNASGSAQDRLYTACHHIAHQLGVSLREVMKKEGFVKNNYTLYATGGGALNKFLMATISDYLPEVDITIPEPDIVKCKEGLLMAIMGALRMEAIPNCISTVTGASKDVIGGAVYAA